MSLRWVRPALFVLAGCAVALPAGGQDRRRVTEPSLPPVCRALDARVTLAGTDVPEGDEMPLDTSRIQAAIDACPAGSGVELRAAGSRAGFISAPLELRPGIVLVVSSGAVLFASRNPRDYDVRPGSCGIVDRGGHGCRPLIHALGAQDAGIMGGGAIDGRGGATLTGQAVSWWDLAQQAKRTGGVQNVPRLIVAERADNFTLYRITLRNSPNFHVFVSRTNGFTAWGVTIDAPATSRNTDGIDPSSSTDVTIAHSFIRCGDDNVAIKAGAAGPATHVTVAHNHFYSGHGMSIGSETNGGVSAIDVHDLTIEGADNGLRIKSNRSRGGIVEDVSYRDVCIRDTKNPIVVDSFYEKVVEGTLIPRFRRIRFEDVRIAGGGRVTIAGADAAHPADLAFDGVVADIAPSAVRATDATLVLGPGPADLVVNGRTVSSRQVPGHRTVPSCDGRFVPFPRKQN